MITLNEKNIEFKCFKYDNSKLLQLTENMILNKEVKTSLDFAKKFMFTFDSQELCPINIDILIKMKVFNKKGNCKTMLIKHFILDTDFKLISSASESSEAEKPRHGGAGKNKENIMLSVDCFKSMCMFSNSEQGKTVKLYYLDLERIFKRFITLEFNNNHQEKEKITLEKEKITLEKEKITLEKEKYVTLYNQIVKKHNFYKFNKIGSCFYIITQGLEYKDDITRIKIGISGCTKRKISKCPHCEEELEDTKKKMSFDCRLQDHRTLWPQLQVKFAVYTEDAELLERNMKRIY